MKHLIILSILLTLSACATPLAQMKNPKTGQIVRCGGNRTGALVGGVIGYHLQKADDEKCAAEMKALGFKEVK